MKLNNKGFALTSIIYMLIVLFLMVILLILANLAQRKVVLDKMKYDIKSKLNQGVAVNSSELPYFNETTGIYYETLVQALSNAQGSGENIIKVQKNIEDQSASNPTLALGKNVALNLNGYTLTTKKTITNNGTLKITGGGELNNSTTSVITNKGTFIKEGSSSIIHTATTGHAITSTGGEITINDGLVMTTGGVVEGIDDTSTSNRRTISTTGNFTMTGGTVKSTFSEAVMVSGSTASVSGGTIEKGTDVNGRNHAGAAFAYSGTGTATLSNVTIKTISGNSATAYKGGTSGTLVINGATIQNLGTGYAVQNSGANTTTINSGTIESNSNHTVYNGSTGTINVNDGNITAKAGNYSAIVNVSSGRVDINGGTIKSVNGSTAKNNSTGRLNITGGTIISDNNIGVAVLGGTVEITGGTITGKTYGIQMSSLYASSLILGNDDGTVNSTPTITATGTATTTTGLSTGSSSSTVEFYDGTITGYKNKAITGSATITPAQGYDIVRTISGTTETATLGAIRTITYDYNYFDDDIYGTKLVTTNFSQSTSTGTTTRIDNTLAKYGKEARWTVTSNDKTGGPHMSPGRLTVGSTYTWSVYLKASKNMKLNVGQEQGGRKQVDITTEWQRITYTFTATDAQYNSFTFYAVSGSKWNTGDILYVHSLELKETPTLNITTDTKPTGAQLGTLPAPTRTNYTFDGWYTSPAGGTAISSSTIVPNSNTTYYAHWIYAP